MENQEQPKKYTKKECISLYSFWFVWVTGFTTVLSILCDILPQHFIIHIMIQCLAYAAFYKMCNITISKGITMSIGSEQSDSIDMRKRLNDDICCGIPPYNYGRDINSPSTYTTNLYNNRD